MEVAVARVYNWEVVQKRKDKAEEDEEKKKGKSQGDWITSPCTAVLCVYEIPKYIKESSKNRKSTMLFDRIVMDR